MPITTTEFEKLVNKHSLVSNDLGWSVLALCGEVGEAANVVKKVTMTRLCPDWVTQKQSPILPEPLLRNHLTAELSDALFYLTRAALDNGTTLEALMQTQQDILLKKSEHYQRTFLK